jgi:hypothetical protein
MIRTLLAALVVVCWASSPADAFVCAAGYYRAGCVGAGGGMYGVHRYGMYGGYHRYGAYGVHRGYGVHRNYGGARYYR